MCPDAALSDVHLVLFTVRFVYILRPSAIHTLVSVPVLSEQMTLTAPRVSTVFKDLQRILFFRIRLAVMVSEAVKAMGRPSGMKAIATETQSTTKVGTLIQLGCCLRK